MRTFFYDLEVNGKGTLNLLENAEDLERFIYASSGGDVYGEQTRDYIHVSDVVEANLLAMKEEGTFNIGTGTETSVNQRVGILSDIKGIKIRPIHTDERKGEVRRISRSIKKAKRN